jgi:hypothetical protein
LIELGVPGWIKATIMLRYREKMEGIQSMIKRHHHVPVGCFCADTHLHARYYTFHTSFTTSSTQFICTALTFFAYALFVYKNSLNTIASAFTFRPCITLLGWMETV